jgi:RNA polymerase sigma factor (sigma-70 family)
MPQPMTAALHYIRRLAGRDTPTADGDGALLRRFCEVGDEQAFATLVHRHGPLVQGVCRRVLGDGHAAEDAFQAAFLVLLRRAAALQRSDTVANWLYTVAYRIALRARAHDARRRALEMEMAKQLPVQTADPVPTSELHELLDAELSRLPQRYRAPLVLCYLEGKTNEEAARLLGWTRRSLTGRLARARDLLHGRLTRRGLTLPAGGIAALAGAETVSAAVVDGTVRAATLLAAGEAVTAPVAALTHGILRDILMTRMKMVAGLVVVGLVLAGSGLLARQGTGSGSPVVQAAQPEPAGQAAEEPKKPTPAAKEAPPDEPKLPQITPLDKENRIAVSFTEETQRFGLVLTRLKDPRNPEKPKLLTRFERGESNNTIVKIDNFEYVFGREQPGVGITWKVVDGKAQKEVKSADGRKVSSTMRYEAERIEITQTVEIVVGEQTRLYDTLLVTYQIENRDSKEHTVGLRWMMDACIGANAGPSVFIPPTEKNGQKGQVIDTKTQLAGENVPPFIRILESDKLDDPNATVAEMGLKLKGLESLDKLVICRWPQEWGGSEARWEWPYAAINEPKEKDKSTCVVLYWAKKAMKAGDKRLCGCSYGLGRIGSVICVLPTDPADVFQDAVSRQQETYRLFQALRKDLLVTEQRELASKVRERMQHSMFLRDLQVALRASELDEAFQKMDRIRPKGKPALLQELAELIDEGKVLTRKLHQALGQYRADVPVRQAVEDPIEKSLEDLARRQAATLGLLKWTRKLMEDKLFEDK